MAGGRIIIFSLVCYSNYLLVQASGIGQVLSSEGSSGERMSSDGWAGNYAGLRSQISCGDLQGPYEDGLIGNKPTKCRGGLIY